MEPTAGVGDVDAPPEAQTDAAGEGARVNPDQRVLRLVEETGRPEAIEPNPMAEALNGRVLGASSAEGRVELEFSPGGSFVQGTGVVQGGAVAAMLDFGMAFAGLAALPYGQSLATASMSVSFLRPAPAGRYRSMGVIEKRGRSVLFASARLVAEDGREVAAGTSTLIPVPVSP